ncbi:uncharacterized protein LOC118749206 isoform X2 [Rhagoletis pomonella]|uniref:uncharacterized protein LOC118749206 isoform X2 n=1 Tax=Rhagoletis pomonella TaxID=28610 RepID=UPI001783151A|nr:uncharacterized protein LOC118749206 isoform X2 [Rhagoletis pomonella]
MTKFLSYFNLSRINDSKDFLGISPDIITSNIIVTLSRNIVIVVKISSQQQVCSWSTQEKLSNKVIYDNNSNQYIGIFGNRFIRCWNGFTADINSVKKIKKSAVAIVPTETGAIILYADGDWDKLSEALTPRKDSSVPTVLDATHLNYSSVKDVNVKSLFNDTQVLTYFVQAEDNKKMHLVVLPLKVGGQQNILKITRKDMTVDLSGYAIVEGDNNFMLLTIWSDQRMFLLNLDENVESEKSPGNFVSILSTLKVDTPLSILGIAKNCVAIYGANSNQEGASLILYNTQFKVAKAQQFFKVFFDCSRIWSIDENIIIAMGQNLSVVTYRMSQELLIDLLGTYSGENNTRMEGDHINEEDYHQSFCSFKESSCIFRKKAVNFKCDSTGKDLKDHLKILEKLRDYSCLGEENQTFVKVDHEKSFLDDIIAVVETPLDTQLINRTLFEFFARQYENCGATGQEMSEKLLVLLSKLECSSENMILLSRFSSAPESILAKVFFSMVIKSDPKTLKHKYFARNMLTSCGTRTFRKTELTEQFRSDFGSFGLLFLLDYFYELLTEPSPMEPFCTETSYLKFEMQIIRWLDGLLHAYFQHLVLSKDVQVIKTLSKWTILILAYSNQIKKLEELLSLLYNLVQKEQLTESSNASMWYCIEELSF